MQTFLDVQRSTMLGYLASTPAPRSASAPIHTPEPVNDLPRRPSREPIGDDVLHHSEAESEGVSDIERRLLAIVRDRTGYPAEMLKLDLDLEADLGIDSIKRVEILGTLRDALPAVHNGSETELMDHLSRARTLGAIVDRVSQHMSPLRTDEPSRPDSGSRSLPAKSRVRRMVLEAVEAPISAIGSVPALRAGGLVAITDDGRGIALATAARLRSRGFRTLRLVHTSEPDTIVDDDARAIDLTSPDAVSRVIEGMRSVGNLAGIVHALPLRSAAETGLDAAVWDERLSVEVRGLFLIAKQCAEVLGTAAGQGGASLVAATAMGGSFASLRGDRPTDFFAGHGAIAGFVKTLAREWEGVRARVVDLDPKDETAILGGRLADELLADDRRPEVGYRQGRRIALRAVETDLPIPSRDRLSIHPGEPILITGGARGITAAVTLDLARRWRPTVLIVGTSPLPSERDPDALKGVSVTAEIKARLRSQLGSDANPAELERSYQALCRAREIRANLKTLRDAGATVDYARVDVRDGEGMRAVLEHWRTVYGPPVGLIHGAGVIQDKLLRDKAAESFDRVIGTKLLGALTLARLIDPEPLRFAAFFSSVAGRYGNRGQADYAAANDALNKLAIWLDGRWSARVVSMIWGPWSGVGMVSDLEQHLGRRGLGMIAPEEGKTRLGDELTSGCKGDVEVLVAGALGNLIDPTEAAALP